MNPTAKHYGKLLAFYTLLACFSLFNCIVDVRQNSAGWSAYWGFLTGFFLYALQDTWLSYRLAERVEELVLEHQRRSGQGIDVTSLPEPESKKDDE